MFLRGLDLNLLIVLDVLLQEKHVTRASARLLRSQPAVSAMLAKLREHFDDDLLRRSGRDVELTPFAQQLLAPLREFIDKAEVLIGQSRPGAPSEMERSFTITMSDSVANYLAAPLIDHLNRIAPHVVLRIRAMHGGFDNSLEKGDADFVIAPAAVLADAEIRPFVTDELFDEKLVCIGDADRTRADDVRDLRKFCEMPFVAVRFGDGDRIPMAELPFEQLGIRRNIRAYVPFFQMLPAIVEHSDRLAIVHERTAIAALGRYNIAVFELPVEMPTLKLNLISHARHKSNPQFQWIRGVISNICASRHA